MTGIGCAVARIASLGADAFPVVNTSYVNQFNLTAVMFCVRVHKCRLDLCLIYALLYLTQATKPDL